MRVVKGCQGIYDRPMTAPRPPRQPVPDPYEGMSDEAVLALTAAAGRRAQSLPARSHARRKEWAAFDRHMGELMRRAMMHVLWELHERGQPDGEDVKIAETIVELVERDQTGN